MNIMVLLDMAASAACDRVALGTQAQGLTYERLSTLVRGGADVIKAAGMDHVVYVAESSPAFPVSLFASAWVGVPFVPLNYRLADDRLRALIERQGSSLVIIDAGTEARFKGIPNVSTITVDDLIRQSDTSSDRSPDWPSDPEAIAVLLYTSGTSGDPKAAVLRHRHLSSYVLGSVEFLGADEEEATLASVPPYHIAGIAGILTAVFGGRRLVQLPSFEPTRWVELVRSEQITQAMVVPTMLGRLLDVIDPVTKGDGLGLPSLRHLSYGGGRMPLPVIERALALLPDVRFVNAYGLTETSSSIAVLTPEDHCIALASDDPAVTARLGSVGRPLPTVEITVRDEAGRELPAGHRGEVWVRGEQVSGEYLHQGDGADQGWFRTKDAGWFDTDGYLFVDGRLDDVIVRGGENLSPGEIEDVLLEHPAVSDVAVVGVPDTEWGEVVAAVVVLHDGASASASELGDFVAARLRSSRRPSIVDFRDGLPLNDTGKVLRRVLRDELIRASTTSETQR